MSCALRLSLCFAVAASTSACFPDTPTSAGGDAGEAGAPNPTVVTLARDAGLPISAFAFGQNYWDWADWAGDGVTGLTGTEPLMTALHLNAIRAGGNNNDSNHPIFDTSQIDAFVAYCRTVGAEPILQVPLVANNVDAGVATPQTAADMVTYTNVTKGYGVKYWEIGNEPDLYKAVPYSTAAAYCTQFASYVTAMKAANAAAADGGASMLFLGPEISQPSLSWLQEFLDQCKDDVDIVTVHRYPFAATATTPSADLTDVTQLRSVIVSLAAAVKAHARPNTPWGITESNVSWDYQLTHYSQASLQASPGTFYAALWTADAMGTALENNLWTFALWNIGERSRTDSVLGFIVGGQPAPVYYAQQMISANFRGSVLSASGAPAGCSVYASYDAAQGSTALVVLNKTSASLQLTLALDTLPAQTIDFPALSATLVQIPDAAGGATRVVRYTADMAAANMAPQVIQ